MEWRNSALLIDKLSKFLITIQNNVVYDETHLNKILSTLQYELDNNSNFKQHISSRIYPTVFNIFSNCPQIFRGPLNITSFLLNFFGVLSTQEDFREKVLNGNLHQILIEKEYDYLIRHDNSCVRSTYLSSILYQYSDKVLVIHPHFPTILMNMALNDASIYVKRSALCLLKKLLKEQKDNLTFTSTIVEELVRPVVLLTNGAANNLDENEMLISRLKLLTNLLADCGEIYNVNSIPNVLSEQFHFKTTLKTCIELLVDEKQNELLLECLVTCYCSLILVVIPVQACATGEPVYIQEIFDIQKFLIEKKRIEVIFRSGRPLNILWCQIANRFLDDILKMDMHFFFIETFPIYHRFRVSNQSEFLDILINKVLSMIFDTSYRMFYQMKTAYLDNLESDDIKEAEIALNHYISNLHLSNDTKRVSMFQSLVWMLKQYLPISVTCDEMSDNLANDSVAKRSGVPDGSEVVKACNELWQSGKSLLHAIVHALCTLMEKYSVQWDVAIEGVFLVKITAYLLNHPELTPKLTTGLLRLSRQTVAKQFLPPQLMLICEDYVAGKKSGQGHEQTSMDVLGPSLIRHLHSPHWEVRDSTLDCIDAVASLAHDKYPMLEEFLIRNQLPSLVVAAVEGDAESYVQASGLHVLTTLVRISRIWDESKLQENADIVQRTLHIVRTHSEAIVRRQAVLLMAELYQQRRIKTSCMNEVYECMVNATIRDLDWEVKANSLQFWEKVIAHHLYEQGVIDGIFPEVTFSKDQRKIIQLSKDEIKRRLAKFLERLSLIGCLNALWSSLNDDSDWTVVKKSSQVIADLLKFLKTYHFVPKEPVAINRKRKYCDATDWPVINDFKIIKENEEEPVSADDVIDGIVRDFDINLLLSQHYLNNCHQRQPETASSKLDFILITPEEFLENVQYLNFVDFVEEKKRWLAGCSDDLFSLLNDDFLTVEETINQPDCY